MTSDTDSCTIVHDPALHEPYFYCTEDKIWCGFDDEGSVYEKVSHVEVTDWEEFSTGT